MQRDICMIEKESSLVKKLVTGFLGQSIEGWNDWLVKSHTYRSSEVAKVSKRNDKSWEKQKRNSKQDEHSQHSHIKPKKIEKFLSKKCFNFVIEIII